MQTVKVNSTSTVVEQQEFVESFLRQLLEMSGKIQETFPILKTKLPDAEYSESERLAKNLYTDLDFLISSDITQLWAELIRKEVIHE